MVDGKEYEEDLLISRDGHELYINAKCGAGYTHYVAEHYKTTHLIKTRLDREAWVVYLNYRVGVYSVHDPGDSKINVGSKESTSLNLFRTAKFAKLVGVSHPIKFKSLKTVKVSDIARLHSRPVLLAAVLNRILLTPWADSTVSG
jgi:hypothetical protein